MPGKAAKNIQSFIDTLPDPNAARAFLERLKAKLAGHSRHLKAPVLLSRLLTLASYSPYLGETVLRHPEHISWLKVESETGFGRVKSTEQLSEELARFVSHIDADEATRLSRFKRRELLRIYLRDCLAIATLSEVTEELSNLADVILNYALSIAEREMTRLHGEPLTRRDGSVENARFAVVALGKLGCGELNYASDVDLLFLYRGGGETAGVGAKRETVVSNKEYFTGVAERVVQMIGRSSLEGAVYRIDLRLRPYGRDGDLVWETERAADYYRNTAHNWERQALIRARASAGSEGVVAGFLESVRDVIFSVRSLPDTFEAVRRAKERIDRKEAARMRGFNVKLGPGGIREIEFIAQALQLEYGGREPWVRTAQTLIVLARLAEKRYLTESERAKLSAAYTFLRTVEHRLQMEHGAQTHTMPSSRAKRELLARRCGYPSAGDSAAQLVRDLEGHTAAVRSVYDRVFGEASSTRAVGLQQESAEAVAPGADVEFGRLIQYAASRLKRVTGVDSKSILAQAVHQTINPSRALRNVAAWAESLATYAQEKTDSSGWSLVADDWPRLIKRLLIVSSSQHISHLLASRPMLAAALIQEPAISGRDHFRELSDAVSGETTPAAKTDALRRAWYRLVIEIGYIDMSAVSSPLSVANKQLTTDYGLRSRRHLRSINLAQTALAEAALRIAVQIAIDSVTHANEQAENLPFAILGLGRLGHAGMDYGSDLDLLIVYDDERAWPPESLGQPLDRSTPQEFYSVLTSQLVRVLSLITREGLLYRSDLRLRPEGKSGPVAVGLGSLLAYVGNRASAWEHSAYLKAREVAGDLKFGACARTAICEASFDAAARNTSLRDELREMRSRLTKEKARGARRNIKWGIGGMTDVYFVTRYLQLRDRIYFPPEHGTLALIEHLGQHGQLDDQAAHALFEGYTFLRRLDHWMRLLLDRATSTLPASGVGLADIARALGLASVQELEHALTRHANAIRKVVDDVF